ncbi:MAG: penicillin-binding transpeptidase domain-containing protein [Desulfomonilaceae bacterium]|nr:penicillin-binding transpeptidase domain-containing protein [Desulfomonilaceae bacterium]
MFRDAKPINWVAVRIALVAMVFAAATVLLVVRAYRLQVSDADSLKSIADRQRTTVLHLEARRGMILDRTGDQMAASLEVDSIYARPRRIADKKTTARRLAGLLEMKEEDILGKLDDNRAFVWIQRRVSPLVAEKIKEADLQGILSAKEYKRFYPLKSSAAHSIGFAGIDSQGLEGLELSYDKDLKVDPVPVTAQKDAKGRPVMFAAIGRDPKRHDLHLTLDGNIQHVVERALDEAVHQEKAKSGVVVVMDADSGEILALAVRPTYNLNTFYRASADVRRNRSVADTYEPGSTFKVFLAAAALDLGKAAPGEKFYCHKGVYRYRNSEIHDLVPHKTLSFEDVIVHSSNIGAVKIAEKLGRDEFYRVLRRFGFGSPTEADLPGERRGTLPLPGRWSVLTKANIAFGQGVAVNPLQLTTAFAAAINGGYLYRPHLMKRIATPLGETVRENRPVLVRRVIKQSTSDHLLKILRRAVRKGTGKAAAIEGADVVGKTGTAQKADPSGGYSKEKYVASFIGALLDVKPRLVICVMLDEPSNEHRTGGKIAAPVFRKIGQGILGLCGSRPSKTFPILALASDRYKRKPARGEKHVNVRRGPKPGEWVVPDMTGLNMLQVLEICGKMKCDASFQGVGYAVRQEPRPGGILKEGAPMRVSFGGETS